MKILFICKYNAFRSRIAEEYFKKINKNSKIEVISRGILMGGKPNKEAVEIPKELLGITINKRKSLPLNLQELIEADLIVIVANDVPKKIFDYQLVPLQKKLIIWKIKDEQKRNKRNIKKIVFSIKRKVDELNKKLEKK